MAGKNRMGKGKLAALAGALSVGALAARDLTQKKHSILRIYPVLGHARYALERFARSCSSISLNVTGMAGRSTVILVA